MSHINKNIYPEKSDTPVDVTHRRNRELESVVDIAKVFYIVQNHLMTKPLYFKGYPQRYRTKILQIIDENTLELVIPPEVKVEEQMTVYAILKKFVEIDLMLIRKMDKQIYHFAIIGSNIAKSNRQTVRFTVERGDVFINHIRASKHIINASVYNVPTTVKVIMHQHEPFLKPLADEVYLTPFDESNSKHRLIKKTSKTYYIRDFEDDSSYDAINEEFIDIRKYLQNDLSKAKKYYQSKGIRSEIITPILYIASDEEMIPLGIIHMISLSEPLEIDKVLEAKDVSFQIVDKVRAANTLIVNKRQDVLDIGRGGAKIKITDNELAKNLIHQKGFSFDLYFKLQAPITMYSTIRNHYWDKNGNLIVGVDFQGRGSRKEDIKRLEEMLEPLEKAGKDKLFQ